MSEAWDELEAELACWARQARPVRFWWRDDDAGRAAPELTRLLALARETQVPLALAVIPQFAQAEAFGTLPVHVGVLQHGVDHVNRTAAPQKKTEFPESEPAAMAIERLLHGRQTLRGLFGERALAVLVPPWNRFPADRAAELAAAGYIGLSTFAPRSHALAAPGLLQVNTHVDIIDWRNGKAFVGEQQALRLACAQLRARRSGAMDASEPVGWLTHHAVHDDAAWRFLQSLFERSRHWPGVRWQHPREIFTPGTS
jgi:hypothetical protein